MSMIFNRTQNAKRNIAFGAVNKIIMLLFPFVSRLVVLRQLGAEYLGLGSLFSSLLQVLNLTELGFSSAVVSSMYKPVAENDTETLCSILKFYRRIYVVIGLVLAAIGLCLLPFLPLCIKGSYPQDVNIYVLYLLQLSAIVLSYLLFAYKNSLITAYQRADVISKIHTAVYVVTSAMQLTCIIVTKNYYWYTIMLVVAAVAQNVSTELVSRRLFPHIKCSGEIPAAIRTSIQIKVKGLFVQKLCAVSRNAFDSILISMFLGLTQVAMYTNYYSVIHSVTALLSIITASILAGVGNSIVSESQQKNYNDMRKFNFVYMWLSGWCTVCLICLYQPFITLVFGETLLFPFGVVVLLCIYFYVLKMGDIRAVYSDACGLWWENRHRSVIEAFANLLLNVFLGKLFGIYGIVAATLISLFFINFLWGTTILYRHYFTDISIFEHYALHFFYALVTAVACAITYAACSFVKNSYFGMFLAVLFIPNCIFFIAYCRTSVYKCASKWLLQIWRRSGK